MSRHNTVGTTFIPFADWDGVGGPHTFMGNLARWLSKENLGYSSDFESADTIFFPIRYDLERLAWAKRHGKKIVVRLDGVWYPQKHGDSHAALNRSIREIYTNLADFVVFQSDYCRQQCFEVLGEIDSGRYAIIVNGAHLETFHPDSDRVFDRSLVRLISTGNFRDRAMLEPVILALDSLAETEKFSLEIVGPVKDSLRHLLEREYVIECGSLESGQIAERLRASDVFIYSHLNPPCPNSVIEAVSCGLPVVGFDSGAMRELLPWSAQLLAPVSDSVLQAYDELDPSRLVGRIRLAIETYDECRQAALSNARTYAFDKCAEAYVDILCEVASQPVSRDIQPGTPVTVLMAVHDGEQFVGDAVTSILDQDWRDFELLIVDDASTDRTPEILAEFCRADDRIRVVRNEKNLGLTASLNRGLREARGDLVARLDADDLCKPARLRLQKSYMDKHPDCTVLGSAATLIDSRGETAGPDRTGGSEGELLANVFFGNPLTHSSVMFRRTEILALGGYDESFVRAQDYDLWLRCVAAGRRLGLLPDSLVSHRLHDGRVTLHQSGIMEDCRQRAVARGLRDILGLWVSFERLGRIRELRFRERRATAREAMQACGFFRRMRRALLKRFGHVPGCVPAFDAMVKRIVANIAQPEHPPLELMQAYATGAPLRRVSAGFIQLYVSRGVSAAMVWAGAVRRSLGQRRR